MNRFIMKLIPVCVVLAAVSASAQSFVRNRMTTTQPTAPAASSDAGDRDLNMVKMPLDAVFEFYGKLIDRTVLKDPNVPNVTIDLQSKVGQKLSKEEQIEAIEVVLEMNGVHIEKYGETEKFVRAVARKDATKEGIPLFFDPEDPELKSMADGKVVSVMISFKNISAGEEAQKALEGFKSNNGLLQVFERTNSILVTDTKQNIARMLKIAKSIDIASPVQENVFVRQIKNASAADVQAALQKIVEDAQKYQEKDGKAQQNAQNAANRHNAPSPTLLRRPGQPAPAPTPTSLESIIAAVSDADRGMIRGRVLIVPDERSNKLIIVTNDSNMKFFDKVIEALDVETTPDTVVKVYRLKYANSEDVSDMINDLIGNSSSSKNSKTSNNPTSRIGNSGNLTRNTPTVAQPKSSVNKRSGEAKAGELSKDNTTVLSDKRINGLVVMTDKELVPTIESIIESMDVRLSQVLIETVIIEVGLGDGLETGLDWISRGKAATTTTAQDRFGRNLAYVKDKNGNLISATEPEDSTQQYIEEKYGEGFEISDVLATAASTVRDGFVNVFSGGAYSMGGGSFGGTSAMTAMSNMVTNFVNNGFNAVFKSDKLNIGAILHAVKTDSRSKYIASPIIMTVDNKEATIEATEMRYLFKGYQYSGSTYSGSPVKDYEQKDLGIKIKVTPKINPNGTVMLTVEEEYSQEGAGQMVDGESQATTVTRKMSADAVLENNMTVIFGGLTQTTTKESESGIPILKDIPWIGKWLFSSTTHEEARSELLVFMTPYVLDDAEAAQVEALRRKNAISDARPWDDHGWSPSALADPVSKSEMMRRLKDEAKKQDEERKTKLAIEKWKMDRAKALEKMDADERKFWLDAHREELEKEEKAKFDAEVKVQEDLQALAAKIKAERMEKANAKIQENAKALEAENEHGRLEAEKKAAEAAEAAATEETPAE